MDMDRERLASLWRGYAQGKLRGDDLDQFLQALNDPGMEEAIKEEIGGMLSTAGASGLMDDETQSRIQDRLMAVIGQSEPAPRQQFRIRTTMFAVAALFALVLTGAWYLWIQPSGSGLPLSLSDPGAMVHRVPLTQATDHVMLTLGDGSRIPLDGVADGTVAREGGTSIVKRRDQLMYGAGIVSPVSALYHQIETPRGERYQVTLSDGTRVWLNAASAMRFPVRFSGDVREVELTGQAYFEVAHEAGRPFIVRVGEARVEVFGTHFDVMGYPDDPDIRTTLLEGSVGFSAGGALTMLKPGDQSLAGRGKTSVRIRKGLDVQEVIGWKDGRLHFEGEDIGQVCRDLSRAFDVRLEYDERIRESFYASFPEGGRLDVVLRALEMTGKIKFEKSGEAWRAVPQL